jgi:hypothetical protein
MNTRSRNRRYVYHLLRKHEQVSGFTFYIINQEAL